MDASSPESASSRGAIRPGAVVLLVDDDDAMRSYLDEGLRTCGFAPETCGSAREALERLRGVDVDAVVTDLRMPGEDGNVLCREIVARHPDVPVVVLTAFGNLEAAVAAMRAGAYDFLSKPVELELLSAALRRAIERRELRREVQRLARLERALDGTRGFGGLVGDSAAMQDVYALLRRIAPTDSSVLVVGESGTGKEVVAKALHDAGPRAKGPFVAINCAAMPESLLEAELFGHERGAFTDARSARPGLFVEANGGTLFLDEIGDMPLGLQAKILRALQERAVRPVGGRHEVRFDARIVSATNRDLPTRIEDGTFREDLYFRVNVIEVALPPLRARGGDVLLLAQRFVETLAKRAGRLLVGIESEAAAKLLAYPWPGNVRELSNCIERAVALAAYDKIVVGDLPRHVVEYERSHVIVGGDDPSELVSLEEVERRYILRVLEAVGGSRAQAAKILGLDRTTLWRRLDKYGVGATKAT